MSDSLTPFSYVILVLVGREGAGPHDLIRMMRQGATYWTAAASQFYAEPKRLTKLGYLEAEKRPGKTGPRTHYTLTEKGRRAVADWLAEPTSFIRIQNEPAVRLLGTDLADDPAAVLRGLEPLREELDEVEASLEVAEDVAATLPHREAYLRLNHRLSHHIVDAYREWLDDVEREVGR